MSILWKKDNPMNDDVEIIEVEGMMGKFWLVIGNNRPIQLSEGALLNLKDALSDPAAKIMNQRARYKGPIGYDPSMTGL